MPFCRIPSASMPSSVPWKRHRNGCRPALIEFCRMQRIRPARQAVCLLKQSGIAADVISNNAVLSASGGAGRLRPAASGNVSVSSILGPCRWRQALFVLCQTMALQLVPDLITYSAGVSACAKAKQWAGSLLLLQQLREAGGGAAEVPCPCNPGVEKRWDRIQGLRPEVGSSASALLW